MRILDDIPFEIDPRTVFASLHLDPEGQYASEVNALIDAARRLARPRALYKIAVVQRREADAVVIAETPSSLAPSSGRHTDCGRSPLSVCCGGVGGGARVEGGDAAAGRATTAGGATADENARTEQTRFVSRALRVNLDQVEAVFPYVATCGVELDSIPVATGDVFGQFCRDTVKEMALWAALSHLYVHLTETFGCGALSSMNPGSGETNVWPIEQQRDLFAFLGEVRQSIGVELTGSCLMVPNKSVSGIFYPSRDGFESCQLCRQERCSHRRAPFDPELWARTFEEAS